MVDVLRLLQISDIHLFADRGGRIGGLCSHDSLAAVLDHVRARHLADTDALLLTGDLVNDEPEGYAHLLASLESFTQPIFAIPGNHDRITPMRAACDKAQFQIGGHVDFAHWRLILLDSTIPGSDHGELSPLELQRLDAALASAGALHVLVALHHHPVALASAWLDPLGLRNASELFAITDRYPSVRAICWGHVHQAFEVRRNRVRLMSVPSTCVQFKPLSEEFATDATAPGYRRLLLHRDGTVESEVIRVAIAGAESEV